MSDEEKEEGTVEEPNAESGARNAETETAADVLKQIKALAPDDDAEEKNAEPEKPAAPVVAPPPAAGNDVLHEATDEDKKGIPATMPEDARQALIRERIKHRKEIAALRAQPNAEQPNAERGTRNTEEQKPEPGTRKTEGGPQPLSMQELAYVFDLEHKAATVLGGGFVDGMDETKAKQVAGTIAQIKTTLKDPAQLVELRDELLRRGQNEAAAMVEKELPFAERRSQAVSQQTQRALSESAQRAQALSESFQETYATFPAFRPKAGADGKPLPMEQQTPEVKFAAKYIQENMDADDRALLLKNPTARLPKLFRAIKAEFAAGQADRVKAERDSLKRNAELAKSPISGGTPPAGGDAAEKGSDAIAKQIKDQFGLDD